MDTLGRTVTLFTSVWRPSSKERRNSWASCWLQRDRRRKRYRRKLLQNSNSDFYRIRKRLSEFFEGKAQRRDLLATHEFGGVSLDLVPEIRRADGVVVHRGPQALGQLSKL